MSKMLQFEGLLNRWLGAKKTIKVDGRLTSPTFYSHRIALEFFEIEKK